MRHITSREVRLILLVTTVYLVLLMDFTGHTPSDGVLTFAGSLVATYVFQSQAGQTIRALKGTDAAPPPV